MCYRILAVLERSAPCWTYCIDLLMLSRVTSPDCHSVIGQRSLTKLCHRSTWSRDLRLVQRDHLRLQFCNSLCWWYHHHAETNMSYPETETLAPILVLDL
ncbi:hypothetical protein EVAR_484_1 [Eumeta japonica]|uniref:Uncharacterized protein n=1 Tax=Eumeta variegata TaxID=151549 RepID=A0A4C1SAP0_EUMVA|nr:hypothetical protein EVAR_484_1 [Eumeta japonica]